MTRINISLPSEVAKDSLYALAAKVGCEGQRGPSVSELMAELARLYHLVPETLVELLQAAQGVAAGNDLDDWFLAQQWRVAQERYADARYWYMLDGAAVDGIWLPGTAQTLAGAMAEAAMLYEHGPADAQIVVATRHDDDYQHKATRSAAVGGTWTVLPIRRYQEMQTYPTVIYETCDDWGDVTVYATNEAMQQIIDDLNEVGIDAHMSDAREYNLLWTDGTVAAYGAGVYGSEASWDGEMVHLFAAADGGTFDVVEHNLDDRWLRERADARVGAVPALSAHHDHIFADWHEGAEHLIWVLTAPIADIVEWAAHDEQVS